MCPDILYPFLSENLSSHIEFQIEGIISKGEIKQYQRSRFWLCSTEKLSEVIVLSYLRNQRYKSALYLVDENNKELFKNSFI